MGLLGFLLFQATTMSVALGALERRGIIE